jgi:hypothetical protein
VESHQLLRLKDVVFAAIWYLSANEKSIHLRAIDKERSSEPGLKTRQSSLRDHCRLELYLPGVACHYIGQSPGLSRYSRIYVFRVMKDLPAVSLQHIKPASRLDSVPKTKTPWRFDIRRGGARDVGTSFVSVWYKRQTPWAVTNWGMILLRRKSYGGCHDGDCCT